MSTPTASGDLRTFTVTGAARTVTFTVTVDRPPDLPSAPATPPAFVYARGGWSCRFIVGDPDRAVSRRGAVSYCGQPRAHAGTSYCRHHGAMCETRTPRRTAVHVRVPG